MRTRSHFINVIQNIFANFTESVADICIGITKNFTSISIQKRISLCVLFLMRLFVMLRTIQLDDNSGSSNIKIHNVIS